jgi:tRNA-uridine 2-sulfurtransferase
MAKIFVGMSGGVDSSAAAAILKEQGHETVGLTLKLWDDASRCCDYEDIMDAKRACWKLGIPHYVLNLKKDFKKKIVDYFISEYLKGRTPNPCVLCNEEIKFAALLKKMREHGFDFVATGHYAAIGKGRSGYTLKKGRDGAKSQEYFLCRLKKEDLKHIKFPLAGLTKAEARKTAAGYGLKSDKPDSQEVCFLKEGESPYEFIERHVDINKTGRGELFSVDGKKIKDLDSAYFKYTVGQRRGLGVGGGPPLYVAAIDAGRKRVIAGPKECIYKKEFEAGDLNMLAGPCKGSFRAGVKVRYSQGTAKARVSIRKGKAHVEFDEPQSAITPGQLAVFYRGATVLGSGFIF